MPPRGWTCISLLSIANGGNSVPSVDWSSLKRLGSALGSVSDAIEGGGHAFFALLVLFLLVIILILALKR